MEQSRPAVPERGARRPSLTGTGFLAIAALALLGSCTVRCTGASSRQIKKGLEQSFLVRSAHIFYPDGPPEDPSALPALGTKEQKQLRRELDELIAAVAKLHKQQNAQLSTFFEHPVAPEVKTRVSLTTTGQAVAQIDETGTVSIDVKVMQAFFRTAVVAGMPGADDTSFGWPGRTNPNDDGPVDERARLQEFFSLVKRVDEIRGRTRVGDLVHAFGDLDSESGIFEAQKILLTSMRINNHYIGPLFFTLSHELGHAVLGHLAKLPTLRSDDCAAFQRIELEADAYAVLLYSLATSRQRVFDSWGIDMLDLRALRGFDDFFGYTYDFATFSRASHCAYPDPAVRKEAATALFDRLSQAQLEATWDALMKEAGVHEPGSAPRDGGP